MAYLACAALLAACVKGFKDEETWSPSVRNAQLESPPDEAITVAFSADGETHTISWPVVLGAGGYEVTVWKVISADSLVLVGEEKQTVDGLSTRRPAEDDTRYKVHVRTLGNPKFNNTEAAAPATKEYTNLVNATAVIPDGTDLTQYFTANTIPLTCDSTLCYELESGGSYTMNGDIYHRQSSFIVRGDKNNPASLSITKGSFVNGGAGFRLQYAAVTYANSVTDPLIRLDTAFNTAQAALATDGWLVVPATHPIMLLALEVKNMQSSILVGGGRRYAVGAVLIKKCLIGYNSNAAPQVIFSGAGTNRQVLTIKDCTITESTFYNEQKSSNYLMQLHGADAASIINIPGGEIWGGGSLSLTRSTFWQMGYSQAIYNGNGQQWNRATDKITVTNCVFVNSFNDGGTDKADDYCTVEPCTGPCTSTGIIRRIRSSSDTPGFAGGYNTYWHYDHGGCGFLRYEVSHANGDKSGTHITSDPQLTFNGASATPLFTMNGAEQIRRRTGDPRWLP